MTAREIPCSGLSCPPKLSGHRIVCNDKYVYSFGGFSNDIAQIGNGLVRELWRYHQYTHEWKCIPMKGDIPNEVASSAMALDKQILYLLGGTGLPFGQTVNNHIYRCNLSLIDENGAVTWERITNFNSPAQYGQAVAIHDGFLYCVGGTNGELYTMDVHRLNLSTFELEMISQGSMDPMETPKPRYRAEIVIFNNELLVFGGGTAHDEEFNLKEIPVLNLSTRLWTSRMSNSYKNNEYPVARKCHSMCHLEGSEWAYLAGGLNKGNGLADVWKFNLRTFTWYHIGKKLPRRVFFHSSALSPTTNRMYTMGGVIDTVRHKRTNAISMIPVEVQTLQDICLDLMPVARTKYHEEALISEGIPRQLSWRLVSS